MKIDKKPSLYLFLTLTTLIVSFLSTPCTVFSSTEIKKKKVQIIREDPKIGSSATLVSRSETLKAGWGEYNPKKFFTGNSTDILDEKFHANALTKTLYKNQQQRDAKHIENLRKNIKKNKPLFEKYKKINSALYTNEARANKKIAAANRSKSPVNHSTEGKAYIKKQAMAKLKEQNAIKNALPAAIKNQAKNKARIATYNKTQKIGGIIGPILSIWGASQNSYDYDDDTKLTSFNVGAFLGNTAMNLSGISGFVSAYKEGQQKGIMVGIYHGAKCIPFAGDAINVFEVAEASIGLVHDTMKSNKIIAENKEEHSRQGQAAVSKLKSLFAQIKAKEAEFKKIQQESAYKIKEFNSLNNQYGVIFNRSVEQEKDLISADSLLLAVDKARPFMDAERINKLKADSEKMMSATSTTVKLAKSTLNDIQTNGSDPENLNNTIKELEQMVSVLSTNRDECSEIENAISPLLGGGKILATAKENNQQISTDATLSSGIYKQGRNIVKENSFLTRQAAKLKAEQDTILGNSKRSLSYFYRNGDPKTKTDLEIAFRETVQYKIDYYDLRKLNDGHKTISIKFQDWRKIAPSDDEASPEISQLIQEATNFQPGISNLCKTLDTSVATTQEFLRNFIDSDILIADIAPTVKESNSQKLKNDTLYNMSLNDIKKQIQFRERGGAIRKDADLCCGYQALSYSSKIGKLLSGTVNKDVCARKIETGTVTIVDPVDQKKKKVNYTIWYAKNIIHVFGSWSEYYQKKMRLAETIEDEIKYYNVQPVTIENAHDAYIGKIKKPVNNIIRGFAFNSPIALVLNGWVDCTIAEHGRFTTRSTDPYESRYWDYYFWDTPKEKLKLQERMKYWSSQLNSEISKNMTAYMDIPNQIVEFTDKYFWKDVRPLFNSLTGFVPSSQTSLSHERVSRSFKKKWKIPGDLSASIRVSVSISANFPGLDDSWSTFLKNMRTDLLEYAGKSSEGKIFTLPGTDLAYSNFRTRNSSLERNGQTIQVVSLNGWLVFIKDNVKVRISVAESGVPPNDIIDPYSIAKTIISNFKGGPDN